MGDFNFPNVVWSSRGIQGGTRASQIQAKALLEFANHFALEQYITLATRGHNILYLFFVNDTEILHKVEVEETNMSDHRIITVSTRISMKNQHGNLVFKNRDKVGNLNFMSKKVDWTQLRRELGNVD